MPDRSKFVTRTVQRLLMMLVVTTVAGILKADDPVFSGPQVGEKLATFRLQGVYDESAGKGYDFQTEAGGKPTIVFFVHELTRPSVAMTRTVMTYVAKNKDKIYGCIVFVGDDLTALEEQLKRARHAMPRGVDVFVSPDGKEGPGVLGLNRNMTLTILVAKDQKVTANFALVQPSLQSDAPKVLKAAANVVGGKVPTLADLGMGRAMMAGRAAGAREIDVRALLGPVIRKTATPEQVDAAAKKVEDLFAKNRSAGPQIGQIAQRIIDAGKLGNYGTKRAQEYFQKWAKKYPAAPRRKKSKK